MNKKLKAAHSHFVAERDKLISELDTLLNRNTDPDCLNRVFSTFREMAVINVAISNIESIMEDNQNADSQMPGLPAEHLEQMHAMAEALRRTAEGGQSNMDNYNTQRDDT